MKFTLAWLKDHLETTATLEELTFALTDLGLEVEGVTNPARALAAFTVGEILDARPHPDADKLRVCRVLTADGEKQIVCGAPNARPGIKVVVPSNAYDAKGLMKSAIRDNDPVMFMENTLLYGESMEVPDEEYLVPLGKANLLREGKDISIIGHGRAIQMALKAADVLKEKNNINAEVLDLRSIRPLDEEAILATVKKTNRVLCVNEDTEITKACHEDAKVTKGWPRQHTRSPRRSLWHQNQNDHRVLRAFVARNLRAVVANVFASFVATRYKAPTPSPRSRRSRPTR